MVYRIVQIDYNLSVDVALNTGVAITDHIIPDAAIATLGDQLLPPRGAKRILAFLGPQLDDGIQ